MLREYDKYPQWLIAEYPSINEIQRKLGINSSNVCSCCKGKLKTYKGYKWVYK